MLQEFTANNFTDEEGLPAGGDAEGLGFSLNWQAGPLGDEGVDRLEPNGAFVETLIAVVLQRIQWYQEVVGGKFACPENAATIGHLEAALKHLDDRTQDRKARGVEGTHQQ